MRGRLTRVITPVVHIDTLVNEPVPAHVLDAAETFHNFIVALAGHGLHEDAHGPGMLVSDMRATNTLKVLTGEVVRVALLLHDHLASIFIDFVVSIREAEERQCEQRREVGVVHEDGGAEAVDFKGEDAAEGFVLDDAVIPDAVFDLLAPLLEGLCEVLFACFAQEGGGALELYADHGVGGDEEAEDGSVVAGTEGASYKPCTRGERVTDTGKIKCLSASVGLTLKRIFVALKSTGFLVESGLGLGVQDFY